MKIILQKFTLTLYGLSIIIAFNAQCPTISCPVDITVDNDSASCSAVVNYTEPIGVDTCYTFIQTFNYTGALDTFVVPAGVTSLTIEAYGAQGGFDGSTAGGLGGYAIGDIAVVPGSYMYIYVGGKGTDGPGSGLGRHDPDVGGGWVRPTTT